MTDVQMETPLYIAPELEHVWKLVLDDKFGYEEKWKACNPLLVNADVGVMRQIQLALAERDMLYYFVRSKYVADLIHRHPHYIKMVLWRLARGNLIERWKKPGRYVKNRWQIYYRLNDQSPL